MYIMYVDESGTEDINDDTPYYILAGAIFNGNQLDVMKQNIEEYKINYFRDLPMNTEIHLYEMNRGKGIFSTVSIDKNTKLVKAFYNVLSNLCFTGIIICVDKSSFIKKYNPSKILEYAYTMLVERFDNFLIQNKSKGLIRVDRTTPPNRVKLSAKDQNIVNTINSVRKHGTTMQSPAKAIVEEPYLLASHLRKGLQVADALCYCANRHTVQDPEFERYWKVVDSKLYTSFTGITNGFGYKNYP